MLSLILILSVFIERVADLSIDLVIDWSFLHCLMIVICHIILHDHSSKMCTMNGLMITGDSLQTPDLETFLQSMCSPINREFILQMRFRWLILSSIIVQICSEFLYGSGVVLRKEYGSRWLFVLDHVTLRNFLNERI